MKKLLKPFLTIMSIGTLALFYTACGKPELTGGAEAGPQASVDETVTITGSKVAIEANWKFVAFVAYTEGTLIETKNIKMYQDLNYNGNFSNATARVGFSIRQADGTWGEIVSTSLAFYPNNLKDVKFFVPSLEGYLIIHTELANELDNPHLTNSSIQAKMVVRGVSHLAFVKVSP